MSEHSPQVWSDLDGTAVVKRPKYDPRNWFKYPLPIVPGYPAFMRGVHSNGLFLAGLVSRRPDMIQRRYVTAWSVAKLGLHEFFGDPATVVLTGSEYEKGLHMVEKSKTTPIGIIDDQPHKLGAALMSALADPDMHNERPHFPIVLGVVAHDGTRRCMRKLIEQAESDGNHHMQISSDALTLNPEIEAVRIQADWLDMHVVPLLPFSYPVGESFGRTLIDIASR